VKLIRYNDDIKGNDREQVDYHFSFRELAVGARQQESNDRIHLASYALKVAVPQVDRIGNARYSAGVSH